MNERRCRNDILIEQVFSPGGYLGWFGGLGGKKYVAKHIRALTVHVFWFDWASSYQPPFQVVEIQFNSSTWVTSIKAAEPKSLNQNSTPSTTTKPHIPYTGQLCHCTQPNDTRLSSPVPSSHYIVTSSRPVGVFRSLESVAKSFDRKHNGSKAKDSRKILVTKGLRREIEPHTETQHRRRKPTRNRSLWAVSVSRSVLSQIRQSPEDSAIRGGV